MFEDLCDVIGSKVARSVESVSSPGYVGLWSAGRVAYIGYPEIAVFVAEPYRGHGIITHLFLESALGTEGDLSFWTQNNSVRHLGLNLAFRPSVFRYAEIGKNVCDDDFLCLGSWQSTGLTHELKYLMRDARSAHLRQDYALRDEFVDRIRDLRGVYVKGLMTEFSDLELEVGIKFDCVHDFMAEHDLRKSMPF